MKIVKMETHMLSQKVIANVTPEFARVYNIPEGHTSVGFFSADNDDIGYLAVDDASKKANIKLIHAETYYGGTTCSWSKYGGSVFVLFSGPKVEDVKSGLRYVRDFIENHSELCNFDGDEGTAFYAQTIPRPGKYFQEWCELKPGESYAYLVGGPIETNYALDKALRKAVEVFYPEIKNVKLVDYKVRVLDSESTTGAKVRVLIESTDGNESWSTVGVSRDVIQASWIALVDSIEYKLIKDIERKAKAYF